MDVALIHLDVFGLADVSATAIDQVHYLQAVAAGAKTAKTVASGSDDGWPGLHPVPKTPS
jgi:hypothetical protein